MSSFVSVNPEAFGAAAQDLTGIGSAIKSANTAAATSTTQVAVAAQDEVSAAIAGVFGSYAQGYQTLAGQAAQFHEQFVQAFNTGGGAYGATEAAAAQLMTPVQALPNLPGLAQNAMINSGYGNIGNQNAGFYNTGTLNAGIGNTGTLNAGFYNAGTLNAGIGNAGTLNAGIGNLSTINSALGSAGFFNNGNNNFGIWNTGVANAGIGNTGSFNSGIGVAGTGLVGIGPLAFPKASLNPSNAGFGNTGIGNVGQFEADVDIGLLDVETQVATDIALLGSTVASAA